MPGKNEVVPQTFGALKKCCTTIGLASVRVDTKPRSGRARSCSRMTDAAGRSRPGQGLSRGSVV